MTDADNRDFAELERAGWADAETAAAYATDFARASDHAVPVLLDAVGAGPGLRLLDLCCGHGNIARAAVDRGAEVTGLDFSPAMLDMARARVPEARFEAGDAMALAFDAGAFDAVVIGFGIPHVPDAERVFAEVARVLSPGGRIAYSVWQDQAGAMQYIYEAVAAHGKDGIALPSGPGAHDYAEPDRARAALERAGFADIAFRDVDSRWQVADPGAPYDFFRDGTVRGAALLRGQPEANAAAMRAHMEARIRADHGPGPVWDVPLPSVVVSAMR